MTFLRQLRALFRKEKLDAEMAEEMRVHLEMQTAENQQRGMSADEARYTARRAFGGVEQIKERARDARSRGWLWLEQGWHDVRDAVRRLIKVPGFTAAVIATLGMGIGLTTIVFSFYHTLVGKKLEVRSPEEILRLTAIAGRFQSPFTYDEFCDLRARLSSVESVMATSPLQVVFAEPSGHEGLRQRPVAVQFVSDNYFSSLGVGLARGRAFAPGEPEAAVLSYDSWQSRFAGDPEMIGQIVSLRGVRITIVGIASPKFGGTTPPATPDLWLPLNLQPRVLPNVNWLDHSAARTWQLLARRKAGNPPPAVGAELATIARTWPQPEDRSLDPRAEPATFFQLDTPQVHAVCVTLLCAVGLIWVVGCVNVVNLLFARTVAREHEFSIRFALGASRQRLLRQLGAEFLVLGLLGGGTGIGLAWWACDALRVAAAAFGREITGGSWSPFLDLTPDSRVFAFTFLLSLASSVLVGLKPARWGTQVRAVWDLRRQTGGATSGGTTGRHSRLLAIQVAACLMLLTGTGLLLRGARRALVTDPGFDTKRLLMVILAPDAAAPVRPTPWELERGRRIEDSLKAIPGVIAAAGTDRAPFAGHSIGAAVTDEGQWVNGAISIQIGRDYFATLGVRPTAGRGFTPEEVLNLAPVVIISESTARHLWPGREALGRTISWPARTHDGIPVVHYTVVGVVPDVRLTELSKTDRVDLFFPRSATTKWIVRTEGAPEAVIASVYRVLNDIDPTLRSEAAVWTLEQGSLRVQRLFAEIPAAFASLLGAIALSLAGVGVFGVVSFAVARRTREFGVRVALGAQAGDVILLVLRQTLPPVVWGTGAGLLGAMILSTLLARFVLSAAVPDFTYGAGAFPAGTFAVASAVLCAVIAVAAWLPARRAAKVDPVMALRTE